MNKKKIVIYIMSSVLYICFLIGCSAFQNIDNNNNNSTVIKIKDESVSLSDIDYDVDKWPIKMELGEIYTEFLGTVNEIIIRDGTTGEVYKTNNLDIIGKITEELSKTEYYLLEDQSDRDGWSVSFELSNDSGQYLKNNFGYSIEENIRFISKGRSPKYGITKMQDSIEIFRNFMNDIKTDDVNKDSE